MNKGMRGSETEAEKAKKREKLRKRYMKKQMWPHKRVTKKSTVRTRQRIGKKP
jgi:hypothetical protein